MQGQPRSTPATATSKRKACAVPDPSQRLEHAGANSSSASVAMQHSAPGCKRSKATGPTQSGPESPLTPGIAALLQGAYAYYPGTQMPVEGWFQGCRGCRRRTAHSIRNRAHDEVPACRNCAEQAFKEHPDVCALNLPPKGLMQDNASDIQKVAVRIMAIHTAATHMEQPWLGSMPRHAAMAPAQPRPCNPDAVCVPPSAPARAASPQLRTSSPCMRASSPCGHYPSPQRGLYAMDSQTSSQVTYVTSQAYLSPSNMQQGLPVVFPTQHNQPMAVAVACVQPAMQRHASKVPMSGEETCWPMLTSGQRANSTTSSTISSFLVYQQLAMQQPQLQYMS